MNYLFMDHKIKITTALVIAYALFFLYVIFKRFWVWWTEVRGYKYYLLTNTFVNNVDGQNNIRSLAIKVKAKTKTEAVGIFEQATKYIKYTDRGEVSCCVWDEIDCYCNKK